MKGGGGGGSGCFAIIVVMVLLGLIIQYWYIVLGLIAVGLAIWGFTSWMAAAQVQQVNRERWAALDHRFQALCTHVERHESDPQQALTTPGWLDSSSPLVRSYATAVARAQDRRAALFFGPRRSPGPVPSTWTPSRVSDEQLSSFEGIIQDLAAAFEEIDQALRLTGWAHHDHEDAPHPQFLLDHRWGEPALLPARVVLDGEHGSENVRRFIEEVYPITRTDALQALRSRGVGPARGKELTDLLMPHVTEDADGFLWPRWVDVDSWGVHRTFGPEADLSVFDTSPVEIANAIWVMLDGESMTEKDITEQLKDQLELTDYPNGLRSSRRGESPSRRTAHWDRLVAQAVHTGMLTGRLQRRIDGTIGQGRSNWPGTYRKHAR